MLLVLKRKGSRVEPITSSLCNATSSNMCNAGSVFQNQIHNVVEILSL